MAKKKQDKSIRKVSFKDAIGFNAVFANEKTNFTVGITLFVVAVLMIISFVSYFSTCNADQSLVTNPMPGDFANAGRVFQNTCGSWGAYTSYFFIDVCFGFSAFLIPIFLILVAANMMGIYVLNLWKWFFSLMCIMIWSSITCAKFINPLLSDQIFNAGGGHGQYVSNALENVVGTPGLTAILALTAIFFLTYLSSETIQIIRKIMNPFEHIKKIPLVFSNVGDNGELLEPETKENIEQNDDVVYDDPDVQEVTFDLDNGIAKVNDNGYKDTRTTGNQIKSGTDFSIEQSITEEAAGTRTLANGEEMGEFDSTC